MFKKRTVKDRPAKRPVFEDADGADTVLKAKTPKHHKITKARPSRETAFATSDELITKNEAAMLIKKDPLKAIPVNVRTTTLTDFQPDVCKDFQQTGYCGYGDTCKFLHIRDESRANKPVTKDWQAVSTPAPVEAPTVCLVCKKAPTAPVETNCGHVFCKACFVARVRKTPTCLVCGQDTGGIFRPK